MTDSVKRVQAEALDEKALLTALEAAEAAYQAEEHEGLAFDGAVKAGIRAYVTTLPAPVGVKAHDWQKTSNDLVTWVCADCKLAMPGDKPAFTKPNALAFPPCPVLAALPEAPAVPVGETSLKGIRDCLEAIEYASGNCIKEHGQKTVNELAKVALSYLDGAALVATAPAPKIKLEIPKAPNGWPAGCGKTRDPKDFRWLPIVMDGPCGVTDWYALRSDGARLIISAADFEASEPMTPAPTAAVDGLPERLLERERHISPVEYREAYAILESRAALKAHLSPGTAEEADDTLNDIAAENEAARDDEFNSPSEGDDQ